MFFKVYLIAVVLFFVIDMLWLGVIAKKFYAKKIGFLLKTDVNWTAAFAFYFLFLFGLMVFVIMPALAMGSVMHAVVYGALFGVVTYATYDLTNLATVKDWPVSLTIVDLIWGGVLSLSVASLTVIIAQQFLA